MSAHFVKIIFSILLILGFVVAALHHNLSAFEAFIRSDPLFYIPPTDTKALADEITLLIKEERELTHHLVQHDSYTSAEADDLVPRVVDNGFLPTSYLTLLPQTIEKTGQFFEKPSLLHSLIVLYNYWMTAHAYHTEAKKLHVLAEDASDAWTNPFPIRGLGAEMGKEVIVSDIALIHENSKELLHDVKKRTLCLLTGRMCFPSTKSNVNLSADTGTRIPSTPLPDTLIDQVASSSHRYGPYITSSTCFPNEVSSFYLFLYSRFGFLPKQSHENYYLDFTQIAQKNTSYAKEYLAQGITYLPQPEGAHYRCTDLRYWGDLSLIAYFDQEFREQHIRSLSDIDRLMKSGEIDEERHQYIHENRLVYLPQMIHNITAYLAIYKRDAEHFEISPLYLVGLRSAYAVTYQTFSRSVWRLEATPQYVTNANIPVPSGYTTYREIEEKAAAQ